MTNQHDQNERLDHATRQRLARLGSLPVDTSPLEHKLRTAGVSLGGSSRMIFRRWRDRVAATAAAAAVALMVLLPLIFGPGPVQASAVELGRLHADIVAGRLQVQPVTTIEEANRLIHEQRQDAPSLPGMAGARVQSCCLTDVQGRLVAVAVLNGEAAKVTLVVAEAPGFAHEMGTAIKVGDRTFWGHEVDGVRMVMSNTDDRWLCVMGDRAYEDLAKIAAETRF